MAVVRWALGCTSCVGTWLIGAGFVGGFLRVLLMPALGRFIRPFEVAGDFAKYFFNNVRFHEWYSFEMAIGHGFKKGRHGCIKECLMHVLELVLLMLNCVHIVCRVVSLLMGHRMNIHCHK